MFFLFFLLSLLLELNWFSEIWNEIIFLNQRNISNVSLSARILLVWTISPILQNCIFLDNRAISYGAGISFPNILDTLDRGISGVRFSTLKLTLWQLFNYIHRWLLVIRFNFQWLLIILLFWDFFDMAGILQEVFLNLLF